jgi:hypothetical protein
VAASKAANIEALERAKQEKLMDKSNERTGYDALGSHRTLEEALADLQQKRTQKLPGSPACSRLARMIAQLKAEIARRREP